MPPEHPVRRAVEQARVEDDVAFLIAPAGQGEERVRRARGEQHRLPGRKAEAAVACGNLQFPGKHGNCLEFLVPMPGKARVLRLVGGAGKVRRAVGLQLAPAAVDLRFHAVPPSVSVAFVPVYAVFLADARKAACYTGPAALAA